MTKKPCRIAVLLSGGGTTMVNLQEHIERGEVCAEIVLVVSSRKNVLGVERAKSFGLTTEVLSRKPFTAGTTFDSKAYSEALVALLGRYNPDLLVMAGFMTKLESVVTEKYDVLNVHPALLPMFGGDGFYGHHVHEAILKAGVKLTGATVHFADAEYDHGPIILQEAVPVLEDDTPDSLAERVQALERRLYPKAVALYADGRIERNGNRVRISDVSQEKD